MNTQEVNFVLNQLGVKPRKNRGQNFLVDDNFAKKIVDTADISKEDVVLEIGPGLGALTGRLLAAAKKVILVEIEPKFCSYLSKKYTTNRNIEIINADVLKIDLPYHDTVVSNIPYTITGPLLEKIFFKRNPPSGTLTIETSIEKRIVGPQKYKNISRIGIGVRSFMKAIHVTDIQPHIFYPTPNIALSLVKFEKIKEIDPFLLKKVTKDFFLNFIAGIMPYKNKNIVNAIMLCMSNQYEVKLSKNEILNFLKENNLDNDKTFYYGVSELLQLSKLIFNSYDNLQASFKFRQS